MLKCSGYFLSIRPHRLGLLRLLNGRRNHVLRDVVASAAAPYSTKPLFIRRFSTGASLGESCSKRWHFTAPIKCGHLVRITIPFPQDCSEVVCLDYIPFGARDFRARALTLTLPLNARVLGIPSSTSSKYLRWQHLPRQLQ
jgi:hypothetical protein